MYDNKPKKVTSGKGEDGRAIAAARSACGKPPPPPTSLTRPSPNTVFMEDMRRLIRQYRAAQDVKREWLRNENGSRGHVGFGRHQSESFSPSPSVNDMFDGHCQKMCTSFSFLFMVWPTDSPSCRQQYHS